MPASFLPTALATAPDAFFEPEYDLHLFVAGATPRSEKALHNLRTICARYLPGRHRLTVVDLHQAPERAGQEGVIGVPMLLKKCPGLIRRLVGDFSDHDRVLQMLGLR